MSMDLHDTIGPNSASAIWNLPYPRNANFTGRGKTLADLRQLMTDKSPAQRVQINGAVKQLRVCVQCMRSGRVQRPQKRKLFQMPATL